jgi:hypothetical protein
MERLYFVCPKTGRTVDVGIESELQTLLRIRSKYLRTACPHCGKTHEWRVADAQLAKAATQPLHMTSLRRNRRRAVRVPTLGLWPQGSIIMRVLLGMILGALLTVASAYAFDTWRAPANSTASTPAVQRTMVNWDVVGKNWDKLTVRVRQEWNKLTG